MRESAIVPTRTDYLGVVLVSAGVLSLENTLSRFFSVMFEYHYSFLLISVAILGLGIGGLVAHMYSRTGSSEVFGTTVFRRMPLYMAMAVFGMLSAIFYLPFTRIVPVAVLLGIIPFVCTGMYLSSVFRRFPEYGTKLYALDLGGAALGMILSLVLIRLGAVNALLIVALIVLLPVFPREESRYPS